MEYDQKEQESKVFEFYYSSDKNEDERGFNYISKTPILKPKDKLRFKFSGAEAVTLYFGWNSPFKFTQIALENDGEFFQKELEVNDYAADGKYKYYVAILIKDKIIIDDPDVIIRRGA